MESEKEKKKEEKKEGGKYGIMIGSGLASAVCGLDDNLTALMVWNRIMRRFDPTIISLDAPQSEHSQKATEHGIRCEPIALRLFQKLYPEYDLKPGGYWLNEDFPELYVDRPDGLLYDKQGNLVAVIEVKCPYGKLYSEVPPKYLLQCQYHLQHIKQAVKCFFFAVKFDHDDPENDTNPQPFLVEMERSKDYANWMWPRLYLFSKYLMDKEEPNQNLLRGKPPFVQNVVVALIESRDMNTPGCKKLFSQGSFNDLHLLGKCFCDTDDAVPKSNQNKPYSARNKDGLYKKDETIYIVQLNTSSKHEEPETFRTEEWEVYNV